MDSFFGIGLPEFVLILLIAGVVMGPERIARSARWLGKTTAQLQAISRGFVRQLTAELDGADDGAIREAMTEIQDLRRQVNELRVELNDSVKEAVDESRKAVTEGAEVLNHSILPPTLGALPNGDQLNGDQLNRDQKQDEEEKPASALPLPKPVDVPDDPDA